jgi:hypothetical protein
VWHRTTGDDRLQGDCLGPRHVFAGAGNHHRRVHRPRRGNDRRRGGGNAGSDLQQHLYGAAGAMQVGGASHGLKQ